ncbi:MAG: hypothetical protein IPP53_07020 [Bacteroidetes bacterium]|nr:hypothetical protein [Bacteroidota bacterium]
MRDAVYGPARFFAKHTSTHIHAVSISKVQCTVGEQKITRKFKDKITFTTMITTK